jgi:hypothetical protein
MNIKNLLVINLICAFSVQAQNNDRLKLPIEDEFSGSITSSFLSEYLAKPGFSLYDKAVSQNEIVGAYHGLYLGLWSSTGLVKSQTTPYNQEFQTYLGIKRQVGWISLDGNIRYDFLKDLSLIKDDLWMADMRLDLNRMPVIQPYIATRYFQSIGLKNLSSGWFVWFGARHSQDLGFGFTRAGHAQFITDASVAHSDGALSREPGWIYSRILTRISVPLTRNLSIAPELTTQIPLDEQGKRYHPYTDGKVDLVGGVSMTLKF